MQSLDHLSSNATFLKFLVVTGGHKILGNGGGEVFEERC